MRFRLLLGGAALLLASVIAVQVWSQRVTRASAGKIPVLATALPARLAGGTAQDEPIAATDEMKKSVGELLNYDDAVFRIYSLKHSRVSVYVAYWTAGKMSPRLVASHTPDVCWPGNGWVRDRGAEAPLKPFATMLQQTDFPVGDSRVFVARGKPEYVVFWHKVGPSIQHYDTGWAPPWWAVFEELWRNGMNLRQEQLFVRISSDVPLTQFWMSDEFAPLRASLHQLGLVDNHLTESR